MNKNDLRSKMQSGFLEAAPDVYEAVLKATEMNKQMLKDTENDKEERNVREGTRENACKSQAESTKGKVFRGDFCKYALSVCAGFALFFVCLFGMLGNNQDNIYVVLDINPSVQIVMDESYQVKKLRGLNQDGKDVIRELEWKKKDPLLLIVDALVENAAKGEYLKEGGGILVTISAQDLNLYDELEAELGDGIDKKLEQMGMCDITTAFRHVNGGKEKAGRELLEAELAAKYGIEEEKLHQMSVMELIQYCRENAGTELEFSPASEKKWTGYSEKKGKDQDKKESLDEKRKRITDTNKKSNADKPKVDSNSKPDKTEEIQSEKEKTGGKKDGQDASLRESEQDTSSGNDVQSTQVPTSPAQPQPQPQPEESAQPQPQPQPENSTQPVNSSPQDTGDSEKDSDTENSNGNKDNNEDKNSDEDQGNNGNKNNNGNKDNNGNEGNNGNSDNAGNGAGSNKDNNAGKNNNNKDESSHKGNKGGE